jgi:hypothetical protein
MTQPSVSIFMMFWKQHQQQFSKKMLRPDFEQNKQKQRQQITQFPEAFFAILYTALVYMLTSYTNIQLANRIAQDCPYA